MNKTCTGAEAGALGAWSWAWQAAATEASPLLTGASIHLLHSTMPGTQGSAMPPLTPSSKRGCFSPHSSRNDSQQPGSRAARWQKEPAPQRGCCQLHAPQPHTSERQGHEAPACLQGVSPSMGDTRSPIDRLVHLAAQHEHQTAPKQGTLTDTPLMGWSFWRTPALQDPPLPRPQPQRWGSPTRRKR